MTQYPVQSPETNPFGAAAQSATSCWSRANQYNEPAPPGGGASGTEAGYWVGWSIPVLIAAIDPDAEAKLDGLNKALVSGGYLKENQGDTGATFPVLASSASGMNEYARTTVQRLTTSSVMPDMNASWASTQASVPGRTVATRRTTAQQAYDAVVNGFPQADSAQGSGPADAAVTGYWSVGPVSYQRAGDGALVPRQQANAASTWYTGTMFPVAMDDEDSQYRTVDSHTREAPAPSGGPLALIQVAGVFDPARIESFAPLSQVPLGPYQPVVAAPATVASRQALNGTDLLPSQNVGGLVSQPVNLITTLSALPALENRHVYAGVPTADPISVIRVRVAGVTGPGALSRERINVVAQQIEQRTGLDVDVVAGSSPSPVTIDLPAGKFGQPPLTLSENWVKEGVAVAILNAVNKTSVVLFTLILVVCVLFVGNAATAAVRGRRRELGVLAAVGWRRSRLFATVLGELAGIGLAAGLLAAVIALPVSAGLGLSAS
ncbi:MAG: FtsX-like permease family protein, partial [Trebonia sp.]